MSITIKDAQGIEGMRVAGRLASEVLDFLASRAQQRGVTVNQLVNQLLKKDMELIKAAAG